MKKAIPITTLFLDIGGVLLTNGWDHHAHVSAAQQALYHRAGCNRAARRGEYKAAMERG